MLSILMPYLKSDFNIIILTEPMKKRLIEEMNHSHFFCYAKLISVQDISIHFEDNYYVYMEKTWGVSPLISSKYRNELNFIQTNGRYVSSKLNDLQKYYLDLVEHSIIKKPNPLMFLGKKVYAVDLLERIPFLDEQGITYENVTVTNQENYQPALVTTKDDVEMIHYAMNQISFLINKEIKPNNIYLLNVHEKDLFIIKKYFEEARIPYTIDQRQSIQEFPIFLSYIHDMNHLSYQDALYNLTQRQCSTIENKVRSAILELLAFYDEEMVENYPTCFFYELNKLTISPVNLTNRVTLSQVDWVELSPEDYAIVLHFNDGLYPKIKIDDDYIRDIEKEELGMNTSAKLNLIEHSHAIRFLTSSRFITLIHYQKDQSSSYQTPDFGLDYNLIDDDTSVDYTFYPTMEKYYQLYQGNTFEKSYYDPKFKGIHSTSLDTLLSKNIHLSQTSLSVFFECPFHYLLTNLLKLDQFETTFYLYYGNVIHKLIENYTKNITTDYHQMLVDYRKDFPDQESYKFNLYLPILEQRLKDLESILPSISFDEPLKASETELSIRYHHELDSRFIMIGKIDQVYLYMHQDQTYAIIVDYKTGNTSFDFDQITSLKQIQLLMYYYLYLHERSHSEHEIGGMYYQQVHLKKQKRIDGGYKLSDYSYDGITLETNAADVIATNTKIKGIKLKSDGKFSESKRLFSKDQMKEIITRLDEKIALTITQIKNGEFDITPYPVAPGTKQSPSCEYCPYKNICYLESSVKSTVTNDDLEEGEDDDFYESAE